MFWGFVVKHRGEDEFFTRRFLQLFHLLTGGECRRRLLHGVDLGAAQRVARRLAAAPGAGWRGAPMAASVDLYKIFV